MRQPERRRDSLLDRRILAADRFGSFFDVGCEDLRVPFGMRQENLHSRIKESRQ